jgi:GT2 family glycosyltransferase
MTNTDIMGPPSSTAIVVVNFNGLDDTRRCLRSIAAIGDPSVAAIVIDNGSEVNPVASLREEFPWCLAERLPANTGWAGGNNAGIRLALERGAEQVILLNNDTTVHPRLVDRLLTAARSNPDFGVLGPVICFMDEPDVVMTDGCLFNRPEEPGFFRRKAVPLGAGGGGPPAVIEVDIVNGCCMMIDARVLRSIGLIDERFFLIHEESDFCLRARNAGYRCGVIDDALVWHKGSSSFKRVGSRVQRYYDSRNLYLLLRKHSAGSVEGRREAGASWVEYAKYLYYRYCIEREHGQAEAADAVLEGLCDALAGRFGGRQAGTRLAAPALSWVFERVRRNHTRAAV